jgi:hypothetical protein
LIKLSAQAEVSSLHLTAVKWKMQKNYKKQKGGKFLKNMETGFLKLLDFSLIIGYYT